MAWTEETKSEITWDSGTGWFSGRWFREGWFTRQIIISWTEETKNTIDWTEETKE